MLESRTGDVTLHIEHNVARAVIDRPSAKNALSPGVVAGLDAAIRDAVAAGCSVFVLRGSGGTLSAGADLKHLRQVVHDEVALSSYISSIGEVINALEAAPFVSVAVVEGYAVAGGLEILLACDLAVAADDARIGDRHLEYGLLPGAGGSVRLTRATGPVSARRLLYTGEIISGSTAFGLGLVSHVVAPDLIEEAVKALVDRLGRHSPVALAAMKRLHRRALELPAADAIVGEREALINYLSVDPSAGEGLAAFAEGRLPNFSTPSITLNGHHRGGTSPTADNPLRVSDNHEDPMTSGRWFEQLPVGTKVRHATRRTVTETDNVLFSTMTMNPAPLHLDAVYASRTEFGKQIINSMFTVALVVGLSVHGLTFGTIVAQLGLTDAQFPAPLFAGDTVNVETEVVEARPSASRPEAGVVVFEHRAYNQRRELVCRLRRVGLMHRQPVGHLANPDAVR